MMDKTISLTQGEIDLLTYAIDAKVHDLQLQQQELIEKRLAKEPLHGSTIKALEALKRKLGKERVTKKETYINYCQSCGKNFVPDETVYYVPTDNNIVCQQCAMAHQNREERIYKGDQD